MDLRRQTRFWMILILLMGVFHHRQVITARADATDAWWHDDWPYRMAVTVDGSGVVGAHLNFTQVFENLGLADALLDMRSVRVVPYSGGLPLSSIPYQETYSISLIDADSVNFDESSGDPYWIREESNSLIHDSQHFSQGIGSIHATVRILTDGSPKTGFSYNFNLSEGVDWSDYETLLYDVWPEVSDSALDQTPDLFHFSLDGISNCIEPAVNGPAMAMDRWNHVSVPLKPYGLCSEPDLSSLRSFRFFLKVNSLGESGYFDPDDEVDLWLDDFRLVDQDGSGQIRWHTQDSVDLYYIYFDTLNHEGHPPPETVTLSDPVISGHVGNAESGGYFHQISGAQISDLAVWAAPTAEKILQSYQLPSAVSNLAISAARGEFEAFQLVVKAPTTQDLKLTISNFIQEGTGAVIPSDQIAIFRVDYIQISKISDHFGRQVLWPDPLYPLRNGSIVTFPAEINQPLWFRIEVPISAIPGDYFGEITIGTAVIPVNLHVWQFSLPKPITLASKVGFDYDLVMETYGGTSEGIQQLCFQDVETAINTTFLDYHLTPENTGFTASLPDGLLYTLTSYEVSQAQTQQATRDKNVWWEFSPYDHPPHLNPAVIDRAGIEPRYLPWLAWVDRVDGIYYPQMTDWIPNPWTLPFSNELHNGNGFFFYPPKDDSLAYDPCEPESNRLIPSIRLELLREGMEDYAYFWMLNGGSPKINEVNRVDQQIDTLIQSRTYLNRIPTALASIRTEMAALIEAQQTRTYFPLVIR